MDDNWYSPAVCDPKGNECERITRYRSDTRTSAGIEGRGGEGRWKEEVAEEMNERRIRRIRIIMIII